MIDFWGSWCGPCLASIPHLVSLHAAYAKSGLEIVGIAYEKASAPADRVRKVQNVRDRLKIPYRLLMGSDIYSCPVKTQFFVESFPSLFLLDENNQIIWNSDRLGDAEKRDLDQLIRKQLLGH